MGAGLCVHIASNLVLSPDADPVAQVSSRLARGLQRARSTRSVGASPAAAAGGMSVSGMLARISRGSRNGGASMSVDGGTAPSLSQLGYGREEPGSAGAGGEVDTQRQAALNFMQARHAGMED